MNSRFGSVDRLRVGAAWPVVRHRLEVPDAISEAMTCDEDDPSAWSSEEIDSAARRLEQKLTAEPHEVENPSHLELEILADCLEGCVVFADAEEHIILGYTTEAEVKRNMRNARNLAKKLSEILGRTVILGVD